jgi:hypothetical protein
MFGAKWRATDVRFSYLIADENRGYSSSYFRWQALLLAVRKRTSF